MRRSIEATHCSHHCAKMRYVEKYIFDTRTHQCHQCWIEAKAAVDAHTRTHRVDAVVEWTSEMSQYSPQRTLSIVRCTDDCTFCQQSTHEFKNCSNWSLYFYLSFIFLFFPQSVSIDSSGHMIRNNNLNILFTQFYKLKIYVNIRITLRSPI